MKTFVLGFLLTFISSIVSAQEQKTIFNSISVVTTAAGQSVQLNWTKGDEPISHFIIERSTDGVEFKQCGLVFLSTDSSFSSYKFRDKIVGDVAADTKYRIGLVSNQNTIAYLPTQKLNTETAY